MMTCEEEGGRTQAAEYVNLIIRHIITYTYFIFKLRHLDKIYLGDGALFDIFYKINYPFKNNAQIVSIFCQRKFKSIPTKLISTYNSQV